MKLTKARFQKIINSNNKQTRKKFKKCSKISSHVSTIRNKKVFNLRNTTLKNI